MLNFPLARLVRDHPSIMKPTPQLDIFPTVSGQNQTSTESQFSTSYSSSQESRPGLLRTIIPEEDDETSTGDETAEPLTPDNEHPPLSFPNKMDKPTCDAQTEPAVLMQPTLAINTRTPTILQTSATPPQSSGSADSRTPISGIRSPKAATPRRQGSMSADAARRISGLFKRANSHTGPDGMSDNRSEIVSTGGDAAVENDPRRHSARIMPQSTSTTRSNTPPGSLDIDHQSKAQLQLQEPSPQQLFKPGKQRSSTVLQIRDKLSRGKAKLGVIANGGPPPERPESKKRAGSVDMRAHESGFQFGDLGPIEGRSLERDILGNQAETGTGLKSRRLSLSLPDDFLVDVAELHSEYKDQSKIIGRRGTLVGSGGSANVKLMYRKNTEELYAVKEFRGKGSKEIASEYEKKIKSEFTIAKSAHHPNIVETFRLCKYKGRWFDVMEYCEGGDLFSLVQQRYLSKEERADDRRCLFVQLIRGIDFLHGNGIAHRDIKLDNLLITKDSKLKITDFGVSEVFCGLHPGMRAAGGHCGRDMKDVRLCTPGISGTKPYLAPEVLSKKGELLPLSNGP